MTDYGLTVGTVRMASAGPITFGPDGILFMADNAAAEIHAVDVGDTAAATSPEPFDVDRVDEKVAAYLGCGLDDLAIRDMAVHPNSHDVYLSVQRGFDAAGQAVLVRVGHLDGSINAVDLESVLMATALIDDAPAEDDERVDTTLPTGSEGEEVTFGERTIRILRRPIRTATITDMAYVDGMLFVAGLSNEEFSSKLRRIPFPFGAESVGNNLEIFHVSHGKWETAAPIRAFVPYDEGRSILASYTCTPVVHFPLSDLVAGTKTVGRTVAELGAVNQPLDMVSFHEDGEEHLLVANSAHGLIKISCADIESQEPLTAPHEPVGVPRSTEEVRGVTRLANLDRGHVVALQTGEEGRQHLRSLKTASF